MSLPHSQPIDLAKRLREWVQVGATKRWPTRSMDDDLLAVIEYLERQDGPAEAVVVATQDGLTPVGRYIDLYVEHCGTVPTLNNQEAEVINKLAAFYQRQSAGADDGWILVKDRLPNNHQHCLIWLDGAQVACIGTLNRRHAHTVGSDLIHYFALANGAGDRQLEEVTHWQPLPGEPSPFATEGRP